MHLTFSIGWIGALVAYLSLGVAAVSSSDVQMMRAAWIGMETMGWFVLVPLAVGAFLSGVAISAGTTWGLLRHYWVVISLGSTLFATVVLLLHMPTVSATADVARNADLATLESLGGDLLHPAIGLVVLLGIQVLNIYKPRGITRYGWRKQLAARSVQ